MNWVINKSILVYAIAAAIAIGLIWLFGELRLRRRICRKQRKHYRNTVSKLKVQQYKVNDNDLAKLNS